MAEQTTDTRRRNLSGIYIFDTLPQDERRKPTCIEDCSQETRLNWLTEHSEREEGREFLCNVAKHLNEVWCSVWGYLKDEEKDGVTQPFIETYNTTNEELISRIDDHCIIMHNLAAKIGLYAPGSEADPNYVEDED